MLNERIFPRIPPQFRMVRIDESRDWDAETIEKFGGEIKTVYIYDAAQHTYCCELRPSYFLIPAGYSPKDYPEGEVAREELDDILREVLAWSEGGYFHTNYIDKMESTAIGHDSDADIEEYVNEPDDERAKKLYQNIEDEALHYAEECCT